MVSTVSSGFVGAGAFTRAFSTSKASESSLGRPNIHRSQRPSVAAPASDDRFGARGGFGPHVPRQPKKSAPKLFCEGRRIAGGKVSSAVSAVVRSAQKPPNHRWEVGRVFFPAPPPVATRQSADSASSVVNDGQDPRTEDNNRRMDVRGTSLSVETHPKSWHGASNASRKRNKKPAVKGSPGPVVLSPQAKSSLDSAFRRHTPKETGHG